MVRWLTVVGAKHNNLKNINVEFPLGRFVCVTGVSGSGKSSLVNDILREALARELNGSESTQPGDHDRIDGLTHLDKVIDIDQSPIGRTPRSNPATYIKVFDEIRNLFTRLPDAKVRGYKPGRFSFNVAAGEEGGGRCEACEGNGANKMEMELIADLWVTCPICAGRRFNHETLQILYKGKNIADVLDMDVQQALDHFENVPAIASMLRTLHDVGLDYLKLGQSSTTLSGGEAQRIKLARELVKRSTGRTLYILDEPTTGLHFEDVRRLLAVLHGFVDAGNTVVVIEHNLDVVKTADWIIDLGPGGGDAGGEVVATGTPEEVAGCATSHTGAALRELFAKVQSSKFKARKGELNRSRQPSCDRKGAVDADETNASIVKSWRQSKIENRKFVSVVGAKQHNLKDVTVAFPRGKTTVCCGPSGSGKTSFAVDTVYAEGQRRYVESLSSYARQFLGRLQPPRVEHIHGLSPAICIEQKNTGKSPRSTVGTVTEIYDYMRVLWARIGQPYCPACNVPVGAQTSDEIVDRLLALPVGSRVHLLAPIEPTGEETVEQLLRRERANGYARARIDGAIHSLDEPIRLEAERRNRRVELVVDRVVIRASQRSRITDSVEQALTLGDGRMIAAFMDETPESAGENPASAASQTATTPAYIRFSQRAACENCGEIVEELSPHHFSFNTRLGWCETCEGLGVQQGADPATIVPNPMRSILDGAIAGWEEIDENPLLHAFVSALAGHMGFDLETPWHRLPEAQRTAILYGCGEEWIPVFSPKTARRASAAANLDVPCDLRFQWRGFFPSISRAVRANPRYRARLGAMSAEVSCESCGGSRLQPAAAAVRVAAATLRDVGLKPLEQALDWFQKIRLDARERKIAGEILNSITSRLRFLVDVGLGYLSLHRPAASLSGGEAQRIQLASQIGTGLTGVLYVLDEPTIGLHPRDNQRLIDALNRLRNLGNTLLLVEHDREMIQSADHVMDFGPGAGDFGGTITAAADPKKLGTLKTSLTGRFLSGRESIPVPSNRRPVGTPPRTDLDIETGLGENGKVQDSKFKVRREQPRRDDVGNSPDKHHWLIVRGAMENNLKGIDVAFPLGRFTCVTGVSGSGKSTLVTDILYPATAARIHRAAASSGRHAGLIGLEYIDKVINVDQSPIGNSPTSNPATFTGIFDVVRELYARLPVSKVRGYSANRFSFNRPGGRCEACQGMGQRCIEMHFLPDVWIECESCGGTRYLRDTLDVTFHEKSIADVLAMPIAEAVTLFKEVPAVHRMLSTLEEVGLGYLQVGQPAPTLSGGEAQRVKLAAELGRPSTGKTLYILDEPTTGLHFDDLRKLLAVLHRLVDFGNTVLCIEHNLDVIKTADWVIDLGPEAGDAGGLIVAAGTPEFIVEVEESRTGAVLKPVLEMGPIAARPVATLKGAENSPSPPRFPLSSGKEIALPWEVDGRKWHLENPLNGQGRPVAWDPSVLEWLIETLQSAGDFTPADWNHRTRVEVTAVRDGPWFCHCLTGFAELLEVAIRVPTRTFSESRLRDLLGVKTLDDRRDLPIYGQSERVRIREMSDGWSDIRLSLRDFQDVGKKAFRSFLSTAADAYLKSINRRKADPKSALPWKSAGMIWHLSQKSMTRCQVPQWKPELLMSLIGRFKSLQKKLELDWESKTAVYLLVADRGPYVGKIVTNMGRGLRIELRSPRAVLTPVQIDRLGEDPIIKTLGVNDWVIFWIRSLEQNDSRQMRTVWSAITGNAAQPVREEVEA